MRRGLDETRVMRRRDDTRRGATRAAWAMVSEQRAAIIVLGAAPSG
jgi:hypothetical protein